MSILWTERDMDIVETLTRRVRLLSMEQVGRIWWPSKGSPRIVRRRLRRIAAAGLIETTVINAHSVAQVDTPLLSWSKVSGIPDFENIARNAKSRWSKPVVPSPVVYATKLAANLFGSSSHGLPTLSHRNHDLLLGAVYAFYREARPDEASRWVGEDVLSKAGYRIKDPDAYLVDNHGRFERAVESAGAYSTKQIESFHWHCVEYGLPYELW